MNKIVTSRENILMKSKEMVAEHGLQSINMRAVAEKCDVAIGSVYNYFPSKNDLLIATVASIWRELLFDAVEDTAQLSFTENVKSLFFKIKKGEEKYPLFFSLHAISFTRSSKPKGKEAMNQYFDTIKAYLLASLESDPLVDSSFFSNACTQNDFVDFVFSNMITLLLKQAASCDILIEIINKTIYSK